MAVPPLDWMRAVRDAVPAFTSRRLLVLLCLGLRMNRPGTGFASARQLSEDAQVDERTARRATDDARGRGYLNRTRRGHRRGDDTAVASEWELTLPVDSESQPDTGVRLSDISTGQSTNLNRTIEPSQPDTVARPGDLYSGDLYSGAAAREPTSAEKVVLEATDATGGEATRVVKLIELERPTTRNVSALVRTLARAGELGEWLDRVRAQQRHAAVVATLAEARMGELCRHDLPGGMELHPTSGLPLCPLCRAQEAARRGGTRVPPSDLAVAQAEVVAMRMRLRETAATANVIEGEVA